MDAIKNVFSGTTDTKTDVKPSSSGQSSGESSSGWSDKLNTALGGGKASEAKEDYLDKGVDAFQQHVLGQGPQDNESAFEQAKDEHISDLIRKQYKSITGKDFPVADK